MLMQIRYNLFVKLRNFFYCKQKIILTCLVLLVFYSIISLFTPFVAPIPIEHDAYIWQMKWNNSLRNSIANNADIVREWRILFAYVGINGQLRYSGVDLDTLRSVKNPTVVVVRIEGKIEKIDSVYLLKSISELYSRLQKSGVKLAGIEVDYDCATLRLPAYTEFLKGLHHTLKNEEHIFVTALPTWIGSSDLPNLLKQTEEILLQVHAVQNPSGGLFDAAQAEKWIVNFSRKYSHPFRVALPTYGSQLKYDTFGNLVGVESEVPLLIQGERSRELVVSPSAVQSLLNRLKLVQPTMLKGIVWFRLPTSEDRRSWHVNTWRTIVMGGKLNGLVHLKARSTSELQLFDLTLSNIGGTDIGWPQTISIPDYCYISDGVNGYRKETSKVDGHLLKKKQSELLMPNQEVLIGWARCKKNPGDDLHAI
jgi:hypothetical protein